jgi:hypothetical protein
MVKLWELNQEFGLEAMPQVPFGSRAESRAWVGAHPFHTSPNMLHIPPGTGLGNGSTIVQQYLALIWYQVQLVLNDGNGGQSGTFPLDYPYVFGFIKDVSNNSNGSAQAGLLLLWFVKALQEVTEPGIGPQQGSAGWLPNATVPEAFIDSAWLSCWSATSPSTRAGLMQAYLKAWYAIASTFLPQQFYQGGWANPSDVPATLNPNATFGGQIWYMLPRFRYYGVDPALTYQIGNWAAAIWPAGNWNLNNSATCNAQLQCTSDK